jgi:2-methylisocitrate lyase-like PEP mutase family enzyme
MPVDNLKTFRDLHASDRVLLLPNAWDAGSAALARSIGAKAIATTSAGLAWSSGYPDGDVLPRANLLFAVGAICRAARGVPVSADIEGGYSDDPDEVAELIVALRGLGVVGVNLEDGDGAPELLVAKVEAIKRRLGRVGDDIFINARTDVFLRELATGDAALQESIARVKLFEKAGADGVFVPFAFDPDTVRTIARATHLPLNILAVKGLPSPRDLYDLGVRRLSAGSTLSVVAFGAGRRSAEVFVRDGATDALFEPHGVTYAEMNDLMS